MGTRLGCGWGREGREIRRAGTECGDLMAMGSGVAGCRQAGWEEISGEPHLDTGSLVAMCQAKSQ